MTGNIRGGKAACALLTALALALSGCGSSETIADKAFGETSERDEQLLNDIAAEGKGFSARSADFAVALDTTAVEDARTAVDAMTEHVNEAFDIVSDVENVDMRRTYEDYLTELDGVRAVSESVVAYLEAPGPPKRRFEDQLVARLDTAVRRAQAADRELLDRLKENASPEEREQLEQQYRDAHREFEERTGG
jgi:hypothetical protein